MYVLTPAISVWGSVPEWFRNLGILALARCDLIYLWTSYKLHFVLHNRIWIKWFSRSLLVRLVCDSVDWVRVGGQRGSEGAGSREAGEEHPLQISVSSEITRPDTRGQSLREMGRDLSSALWV